MPGWFEITLAANYVKRLSPEEQDKALEQFLRAFPPERIAKTITIAQQVLKEKAWHSL